MQICPCDTGVVKVITNIKQNEGLFGMSVDKRFILLLHHFSETGGDLRMVLCYSMNAG